MTREEQREYNRKWARELRKNKKRIRIRIEGSHYKYQEIYIDMPVDEPKKCMYCTQLLDSDYHKLYPCQRYEVMTILFYEDELNG
jgi:hypothetical protein